jgi:hypothetical protein
MVHEMRISPLCNFVSLFEIRQRVYGEEEFGLKSAFSNNMLYVELKYF